MSVSEHYNYKGGEGRLDEMLHEHDASRQLVEPY